MHAHQIKETKKKNYSSHFQYFTRKPLGKDKKSHNFFTVMAFTQCIKEVQVCKLPLQLLYLLSLALHLLRMCYFLF